MDMNRLSYFCTVAQTGSLARAAEFLGLSPAALSKSMRILEEETGLELMRPAGRGIVITQEGVKLAERGQQLLHEFSQLTQFAKGTSTQHQQLRLGTFEVFSTYLLGELLTEFNDPLDLVLHELTPGKIEQALLEMRIDVGLSYMAIPHKDLDHLELGKVHMGVYGIKENFTGMAMADIPFVIPVEPLSGAPTKAQGLDGWQPSYGPRNVRFKVTLMESALEIARRGAGVAYLPSFVIDIHNRYVLPKYKLQEISLSAKNARNNPVYLIKRKDEKETVLMKKLAKAIRQHL